MIPDHIDFSAFSSLWFWGLLVGQWTLVLMRPMGIPFDVIQNADRADTFRALLAIQTERHQKPLPVWGIGLVAFVIGTLVALAIWYGIELAVALLFIIVPWICVIGLTRRAARQMTQSTDAKPGKILGRLTFWSQILGLIVFFTASFVGIFFIDPFIG